MRAIETPLAEDSNPSTLGIEILAVVGWNPATGDGDTSTPESISLYVVEFLEGL